MALTKITGDNIQPGSITTVALAEGAGGGPKISNVSIANSSYTILDDTAIALEGGYLVITGTGFASGCQVVINSNNATSVTFVDSNTIRAQVGAADAGTKTVYVVNTDGGTAIRVNGLTYSATPTWVTGSTLTGAGVDDAISIQLDASLATSYQLQAGSSLPAGLSLAANGLLSGTVTGIEEETTYNFIVEAIDAENQESPRSFSITITSGDDYFYATTLLLNGDGTNGVNNNTFVDSSNNNFAITRNGNVAQGTFSPFSAPDGRWSNYFDGTGDYLSITHNTDLTQWWTTDYTLEMWIYPTGDGSSWYRNVGGGGMPAPTSIGNFDPTSGTINNYWSFGFDNNRNVKLYYFNGSQTALTSSLTVNLNQWNHIAFTKTSSGVAFFCNGVGQTPQAISGTPQNNASYTFNIGQYNGQGVIGYIAGVRVIKGSAVYSGTSYTLPIDPLTAITNTSLLTCQSNRFKDNSTNNFAITRNGDVKVTSFSPFVPTGSYSAATNGGSGYFDGSGDYLSVPNNSLWNLSSISSWTIECMIYINNYPASDFHSIVSKVSSNGLGWYFMYGTSGLVYLGADGGNPSFSGSIPKGSWTHVAIVKNNSSNVTLYLNGISSGTISFSSSDQSVPMNIGYVNGTYPRIPNAYISNFRIVSSAVYTSNFTPPTAPVTVIENTSLLLNFTNGGIIDYTGKNNLETVGNAQISTSVKKYGTGSMYFDGTGDYIWTNQNNSNLILGTGHFTIEFWFNTNSSTRYAQLIGNEVSGATGYTILINNSSSTSGDIAVYLGSLIHSATSVSYRDNVWHHLALTRDSSGSRLFLNGVQQGSTNSATSSSNFDPSTFRLAIGANLEFSGRDYAGYIDDLRITKGFARYTSNFTPPTSAHKLR